MVVRHFGEASVRHGIDTPSHDGSAISGGRNKPNMSRPSTICVVSDTLFLEFRPRLRGGAGLRGLGCEWGTGFQLVFHSAGVDDRALRRSEKRTARKMEPQMDRMTTAGRDIGFHPVHLRLTSFFERATRRSNYPCQRKIGMSPNLAK